MENKKELISYLVFGVMTTVVSIVSFQLCNILIGEKFYLLNNILSWILAVAFAFVTNKLWVFCSKKWDRKVLKKELSAFLGARVFSLVLEEVGLFLLLDILKFEKTEVFFLGFLITGTLIAKLIMQVLVIVANYIFSKFFIFKKS